jgi:hypothetical protein
VFSRAPFRLADRRHRRRPRARARNVLPIEPDQTIAPMARGRRLPGGPGRRLPFAVPRQHASTFRVRRSLEPNIVREASPNYSTH